MVVEDSIVRGTTTGGRIKAIRDAGAKEIIKGKHQLKKDSIYTKNLYFSASFFILKMILLLNIN